MLACAPPCWVRGCEGDKVVNQAAVVCCLVGSVRKEGDRGHGIEATDWCDVLVSGHRGESRGEGGGEGLFEEEVVAGKPQELLGLIGSGQQHGPFRQTSDRRAVSFDGLAQNAAQSLLDGEMASCWAVLRRERTCGVVQGKQSAGALDDGEVGEGSRAPCTVRSTELRCLGQAL